MYAQHSLWTVPLQASLRHSSLWKKAGLSHFFASKSCHQLQPNSRIAQVLFKIANLNFLQTPLLVFHTRVCNLIAFGMRCLLYYLFLINFFFEVGFHVVLVGSFTLYLRITLNFWHPASTPHSAGVTSVTLTVLLCSAGDCTKGLVHSSWAFRATSLVHVCYFMCLWPFCAIKAYFWYVYLLMCPVQCLV